MMQEQEETKSHLITTPSLFESFPTHNLIPLNKFMVNKIDC